MPLSCSVVLCRALLMPLPKGRCPSLFCCCLSALPCSAAAFLPFLVLLLPFCGKADAFACGGRWRSLAKALPLPCVSNTSTAEPVPFPCLFRAKDRRPSLHFCSTPLRRAGGGGWGWGGLRNQRDDTQVDQTGVLISLGAAARRRRRGRRRRGTSSRTSTTRSARCATKEMSTLAG